MMHEFGPCHVTLVFLKDEGHVTCYFRSKVLFYSNDHRSRQLVQGITIGRTMSEIRFFIETSSCWALQQESKSY